MRYYVNEGSSAYSPVVSQCDEEVHWFHGDALGSTVGLTDALGGQTDTFLYEAFGTSLGRTGATETPCQFVGGYGYFDEQAVALEEVWWRWLAVDTGTWVSGDFHRGISRYQYAHDSPTAYLDPDGRVPILGLCIVVVIGAALVLPGCGKVEDLPGKFAPTPPPDSMCGQWLRGRRDLEACDGCCMEILSGLGGEEGTVTLKGIQYAECKEECEICTSVPPWEAFHLYQPKRPAGPDYPGPGFTPPRPPTPQSPIWF